jgi:transposase-like protein
MKITISHYEFLQKFPDEAAARKYLELSAGTATRSARTAALSTAYRSERVGYYRCLACKEDFTVRTGTIFERSHIPLDKWLYAMYLIATARKGDQQHADQQGTGDHPEVRMVHAAAHP